MYFLHFPLLPDKEWEFCLFLLGIFCCLGKIACLLIPRGNFIPPIQIILEFKASAKASDLES